ncbi:PAS domain-containing sensor histidine kinase [Rhodocytophaga aerolata]|uniref:histidine kinase n=1 Tax=Rhodocytophaga aerolata TaxID=455078 RepID=A0ABT8R2N1_9BACT|nr:PAS domain-containing sensor histidine kinase [Rhodocytophaga aerolata]MDO1446355.1 PAS domain-containing sensor histidine kinase [Rhodocytophaga aerolata]
MKNDMLFSQVFGNFVQQSPLAYFIFHPAKRQFIFLNQAFSQIGELSGDKIANNPILLLEMLHAEDSKHVQENYQQLLAGEDKTDIEFRIIIPEGTEKWIRVSAGRFTTMEGEQVLAGTAEDITKDKTYVNNLHKFAAKKNSILEILSHDLAGPLSVLQNMAGILARKMKPYENQEIDELIGMMAEACQRNVKLIRDFVANEFLESSAVVLNKQRINIVERLKQVMEEYKNSEHAIAKNFEFVYSNDPMLICIDDTKFMQVINNLFSNAIKFTPDHGTITLAVEEKEHTVLFVVKDTGIGIPAAWQPVLFDKFSIARRPGLRGEESTGLGMSIIKTLVNWHGGTIWFESEESKGTVFYIEIPKE